MSEDMTQEQRINLYARYLEEQTKKAVRPYRADGYVNLMTRYGTQKDAAEAYRYVAEPQVPDEVLEEFYESNGLFAKIIDTPAEEAVKHGFELEGVTDESVREFYDEALDELDWDETAMTAIKWARLFGGSIAILFVNDGGGLEDPLDWKNIQSIDDIRVYDRSLIQPDYSSMYNYDPTEPFNTRGSRWGMPEYYHVYSRYGNFTVHDSRCLVFQNGILPENATNTTYQIWGMPEYIRINKAIQDAELAHRSAPRLLERSVQPIYKMKDLSAELATVDGENVLLKRLQSVDMARSILNTIVVDSDGEDYDFKSFTLNGISDAISASCSMLSAVTSIPQTVLFGQGVNGLNSTDDTSMENYYNFIERIQRRMLKGNLRYLLSIIFQAGLATGEVDEVPKLNVKFNPLWSLSDSEQAALDQQKAQTQQVKAQTTQIYVDMQAIDPSEVRKKLADSGEYDVETLLDEYDEEELFEVMQQQEEESGMEGMEGGMEAGPEGQPQPQNGQETTQNPAQASVSPEQGEANQQPQEEENTAPEAAPAATKLPQDMTDEEREEVEKNTDSRADGRIITDEGNSNSGNHNHEGRPGEVGGSAPSASALNEAISTAFKLGDDGELGKAVRKALRSMPVGSKITTQEFTYTKVDDDKYEYEWANKTRTANTNNVANGVHTYDETLPTVEIAKAEETAEQMVENGELDPDNTGVTVEGYEDKEFKGEFGVIGVSSEEYGELRKELSENSGEAISNDQMDTYLDALDAFKGANYVAVCAASADFGGGYEEYSAWMDDSEKEEATKRAEALEDFITKADKYEGKVMRALGFDVNGEYTAEQEQELANLLDSCKVGSTIDMGHTSSWTTSDGIVQQILAHRTGNDEMADHSVEVVFTCNNSTSGVGIAKYCKSTPQAEVMFSKNQEFTVKSVSKKTQWNGNIRYDIEVEENKSSADSRHDGAATDGGPGSGNHNHKGVPGQVGGSAPSEGGSGSSSSSSSESEAEKSKAKSKESESSASSSETKQVASYTEEEKDAVNYWAKGNNGWGYQAIRQVANGYEPQMVQEQRKRDNNERANEMMEEIQKITDDFDSAVSKAPDAEGELIRYEQSYRIPAVGDEVTLPKYTSFASEDTDHLRKNFGIAEGLVYKVKGSSSFADISKIVTGTSDKEHEAVTRDKQTFSVAEVKTEYIGGNDWSRGTPYNVVYLEASNTDSRTDSYPGSVGVIITSHGKILTGTRNKDTDRGQICGPGGHIEAGETPEQAAIRETQEEFGITPKDLLLLGHGPQEPGSGLEPYIYLCTEYTGQIRCRDHEMRDPQFLDLQQIMGKGDELFQPFADSLNLMENELGITTSGRTDARPHRLMNADALEAAFEEAVESEADGDEGSGNWGHEGRPGEVGGSKEGGGAQNRLGTKDKGYTSEAKEKKKAKEAAASATTKTTAVPKKPTRPKAADFKDADGYVDYEALNVARAEFKAQLAAWEDEIGKMVSEQVPEQSMTIEELESWCETSGASIYGSLEGVDGRLLTSYTERFEHLAADFPEGLSQTMIDGVTGEAFTFKEFDISYDPSGVDWLAKAATGIMLSGWAKDAENLAQMTLEEQADGYTVSTGNGLTALWDHEYGHMVYAGLKWDGKKTSGDREAMKQDLLQNVYGKSGMSEYATTNDDELFAEGFSAYYGGMNTEFAKATGEYIERWRFK